jgi:hypothetical protein
MAPLTNEQKTTLVLLAKEAFSKRGTQTRDHRPETADQRPETMGQSNFDDWRRAQCMQVVERPGLTACRNEDYLPLRAHFLGLLGRKAAAEIALQRTWDDPRRQALAKLQAECQAAADVMPAAWNYAAGFVRNKRGVSIDDADAKTVWHAVFLIRRRASQLRRTEKSNYEMPARNASPACNALRSNAGRRSDAGGHERRERGKG